MLSLRPGGAPLGHGAEADCSGCSWLLASTSRVLLGGKGGHYRGVPVPSSALLALGGDPEPGSEQFSSHSEALGWKSAL